MATTCRVAATAAREAVEGATFGAGLLEDCAAGDAPGEPAFLLGVCATLGTGRGVSRTTAGGTVAVATTCGVGAGVCGRR